MSRLTRRHSDGTVGISQFRYYNYDDFQKLARKLAEYEDLEEQGLLLKLPCKIRDKYFRILYGEIYENEFNNRATMVSMLDDGAFGKTVFLTKEEAEKELERLENK